MLNVDNLTGQLLEQFVSQRKGIKRTPATFATGKLLVTGTGMVNVGDLFETKSGVQFEATESKSITNSSLVFIKCKLKGIVGNIPANQITQMPITLPGITAVTNPAATGGGYEAESDASIKERYYIAMQTPPTSGNVYHYLQWAKEVPGVGDAKVFPLDRGEGTVEVVIIDQLDLPATPALVLAVQEHIDPDSKGLGYGEAPIGAKCYVVAAEGLPLNINVTVVKSPGYEDTAIINNIKLSINNYLTSIAFVSDYVSFAKIGEAIINSEGVEDYDKLLINGSTSNVDVGPKQVAVLGGVMLA
nr:baseplate J/gp47 family protein [Paenibacillus sp. ACRRX]